MKANAMKKNKLKVSLLLMMFFTLLISTNAKANEFYVKANVPVAICSTGGTHIPLPYFVCCQLIDQKGHRIWDNTWVPTTCKNADSRASYDMGCKISSPVYGMGSAITGNCQFSYSTGRYKYYFAGV